MRVRRRIFIPVFSLLAHLLITDPVSANTARNMNSARVPRKLSLPSAALRGRWDAAYMRSAQPSTLVDVSVTRDDDDGYLRGTADTHETITMQFAEQFLAQLDDDAGASDWRRRPSALRYHLAQCPLERVPALQADAHELLGAACDAACASLGRTTQPVQTNLWFAIGATTSGLH